MGDASGVGPKSCCGFARASSTDVVAVGDLAVLDLATGSTAT
jgi:hypothetical protein